MSFNTVLSMHCAAGNVPGAYDVLLQLVAAGLQPTAATYRPLLVAAALVPDAGPIALHLWQHIRRHAVSPDLHTVNAFIGAVMQLSDPSPPPPPLHKPFQFVYQQWIRLRFPHNYC